MEQILLWAWLCRCEQHKADRNNCKAFELKNNTEMKYLGLQALPDPFQSDDAVSTLLNT